MITHIIWDFNGTVLDDVKMSVEAVNDMLKRRNLPPTDVDTYKDTLVMPLTEYYKTVGIYCDDISVLSNEFRACCQNHNELARIFDGVKEVIDTAKEKGIKNILLSSLYHEHLESEVKKYGIGDWFDTVLGLPDKNLGSKFENAQNLFKKQGIDAKNTLFLGDIVSDAQTAKKLGADCILIANGHMSFKKCSDECDKVVLDVKDVIKYI